MTSRPSGESDPKGGENDAPEDKVTRGNFEALARGLFRVTPEEFRAKEARKRSASKPGRNIKS
jgi:hypothetical protein